MLIADIKKIPKLGEYAVMSNSVHGEVEKLKCVLYIEDADIEDMIHVCFASDVEEDNVNIEQGVKFYIMRTYIPIAEEKE